MATEINLINDDVSLNSVVSSGNITASAFTGDGTNITNLPTASVTSEICKTTLLNDSTINDSATFTQKSVFLNTAQLEINIGGFTSSSTGIVVPSTGVYLCMVNAKEFSTLQRTNAAVKITINGVIQTEIGASGYIRNLSAPHQNSSVHIDTVLNLTAGDEIGLAFGLWGNAGVVSLEGANSSVCLYRVS